MEFNCQIGIFIQNNNYFAEWPEAESFAHLLEFNKSFFK